MDLFKVDKKIRVLRPRATPSRKSSGTDSHPETVLLPHDEGARIARDETHNAGGGKSNHSQAQAGRRAACQRGDSLRSLRPAIRLFADK